MGFVFFILTNYMSSPFQLCVNSETVVGQHLSSSMNGFTVPSYYDHGPMQMLYSSQEIVTDVILTIILDTYPF